MKTFIAIPFFLVGATVLLMLSGCEVESVTQAEVTISPGNADITKGDSVEFRASGWNEYVWTLDNESIGILSRRTGDTTIYTSIYDPGTSTVMQVVTVSATGSTTSSLPSTLTASAIVTHR
jgi:hypothetical protein